MPTDKPTALGKEIGHELRLRRQRAGLNGAELAHRLRWTTTKVSRIETGVRRPVDIEIGMYLASCGASQDEVDAAIALAGGHAHGYRVIDHSDTVKDETSVLIFHGQLALTIEGYEPTCVPALLRTEAYARALVIEAGVRHSAAVEHRLEGLNQRQAIIQQPQQPSYTFYVHENALTTPVGDNLIMNEQLLHLTFLSSWRRCTLRVVPRSAGGAGLIKNGFERMTFTDMDPLAAVDLETNSLLLDSPSDTDRYRQALDRLDGAALSEDQSRTCIANQADRFDGTQHVDVPAGGSTARPVQDAEVSHLLNTGGHAALAGLRTDTQYRS